MTDARTATRAHPVQVLAAIGLGVAAAPLDTSVNVAFPAIHDALSISVADIRMIVAAYVLTYGSLLLVFGRVADVVGHRRVFLTGLVWSLVALSLCATAQTFHTLLVARALQGVGAAMLLSTAPALATLSLGERQRTRAVSAYMLSFSLATAAGPLIGGLLLVHFEWPSVFWFRVPLVAIAAVVTARVVPHAIPSSVRQRLDIVALPALGAGLAAVLLAATQIGHADWSRWLTLTLAVTGAAGIALSLRRQRASDTRLLDLELFSDRAFGSVNLAHLLVNGASFMVLLLVPFHLASTFGGAGALSGLVFALSPFGFVLASPLAARWMSRVSAVLVGMVGLALTTLGLIAIALWRDDTATPVLCASLLLHGFGYGLFQVASLDYVMSRISRERHGVAGGLNMLTRTAGVVLGISVGTAAFALLGGDDPSAAAGTFRSAFSGIFFAAAAVVVAVIPLLLLARRSTAI